MAWAPCVAGGLEQGVYDAVVRSQCLCRVAILVCFSIALVILSYKSGFGVGEPTMGRPSSGARKGKTHRLAVVRL